MKDLSIRLSTCFGFLSGGSCAELCIRLAVTQQALLFKYCFLCCILGAAELLIWSNSPLLCFSEPSWQAC